jgi:ribosomal protein L3 glutamine methyltransferase
VPRPDSRAGAALPYDAAVAELSTVGDLLRFGITTLAQHEVFFGHGFPDARSEITQLLAWALGLAPDELGDHLQARLLRSERKRVLDLFSRRVCERVPVPYLTGEAWLAGFRFEVDPRVLIPRSFISDLLADSLAPWVDDAGRIAHALDMCTGSGCLAVLMAHAFPEAAIDAVDVSTDALEVARANIVAHGLEERVCVVGSDLFSALDGRHYDLIVSNPPYVNATSMASLPPEYREEPALALAGGEDGLDLVRRLLAEAPRHLAPDGLLVVEIGHNRDALEAAYPRTPFTWLETHAGDEFVFLLTRDQLP